MSGIDWTMFEDNQEGSFGWLLRNNATAATTTSVGLASGTSEDLHLLPLDDVETDHMMTPALVFQQLIKSNESGCSDATSSVEESDVTQMLSAAPSRVPNPAVNRVMRPTAVKPSAAVFSMIPHVSMGQSARLVVGGSYEEMKSGHDENMPKKVQKKQGARMKPGDNAAKSTVGKVQQSMTTAMGEKVDAGRRSTRGKVALRIARSKRPQKRQKSDTILPAVVVDSGTDDDFEKKQLRRVKNLVSVREFRKRKMKQQEQNEARLRRLEAENIDLKMRLKIGKEAIISEQREKKQIKDQMREMLQRDANEQEIAQFLNMYKVTYSDYGPRRREKLHYHLSRIRELILPTQVTKLCLYSVEQGVDMLKRDHVIKEDPMSAPESASATMSLWGILADELDVSEDQQRQILKRRAAIKKVRDDLSHTLSIVEKLKDVTDEKNAALETQVAQLQQILTPSQATRFIIWVKENPAFMYMLDKLVDTTLQNNSNSTGK